MENQLPESKFKEIYEKYASVIHSRCYSFLGSQDEAWDATQDVFMKLMRSYGTIQNTGALYSWLLRTATNHCISLLRRKRGVGFDENIHNRQGDEPSQEKVLVLKDILEQLFRPWDKKVREVVVYTYIDGYSQLEISKLTGLGESTIRRYLTKFRRHAQKWKEKQENTLNEM